MPRATVTSKGQITLPKEVRAQLGVGAGDLVDFRIGPNGTVTLSPQRGSAERLWGKLSRLDLIGASVEAMDEALSDTVSQDDVRIREGK